MVAWMSISCSDGEIHGARDQALRQCQIISVRGARGMSLEFMLHCVRQFENSMQRKT